MTLSRFLATSAAIAVASIALAALSPAAGADEPWTQSANHGLPGAVISTSGAGCVGNNVSVILTEGTTIALPGVANVSLTPAVDGTWSTTITVPISATPGDYLLWGQCVNQFNYEPLAFTVDDPSATTTVPTTSVPTTSTTEPGSTTVSPTSTSTAAAADATEATPTFTG